MRPEALRRAVERRRALGLPNADTDAFRLVHGAGDDFDGVTVDVYAEFLVASTYRELTAEQESSLLDALFALGYAGVYLKRRPKTASRLSEEERRERAPEHALRGVDAPSALVVRESGVPFEVRLGDGLSTGLFLDQRDNRARLRDVARDRTVLNLFAYTCAFGVVAALGGARSTTNLDVAKGVLERGRRNYALSGLEGSAHTFLARDALEALPRLHKRGERFDLVVLDPPSFATTKRGRFSVERDYPELVSAALLVVADGGALVACTNHQATSEERFERMLASTLTRDTRRGQIELAPPPPDHPPDPREGAHLKTGWIWLR
jgi:23S rRNA (cytosine1962-C5)-methyltransferase